MKKAVIIDNVNYSYNGEDILKNISLNFYSGINTFICGTCGSGKTMLLRAIDDSIKYSGSINCCVKTVVLFDKSNFFANSVEDELKYLILNDSQKKFVQMFFNKKDLKQNPNNLSFRLQKILILCSSLCSNPKIIFIDNLFSFLSLDDVNKFIDFFKKNNITIVSVSNNIEEALLYDYMIVLDKGIVAIEGKTNQVLQEEKLLKRLGIGLPFYVDLCIQLKLYGLIDKVYLSKEELVSKLWK
jgi:energy-coupling factor transporter ATP-binding protein EcfA2